MSVSFGKHWAKCCQDHLVSLSRQLPLRPRNNSSTVALLRLTHFFWPKIHGVLGEAEPAVGLLLDSDPGEENYMADQLLACLIQVTVQNTNTVWAQIYSCQHLCHAFTS